MDFSRAKSQLLSVSRVVVKRHVVPDSDDVTSLPSLRGDLASTDGDGVRKPLKNPSPRPASS